MYIALEQFYGHKVNTILKCLSDRFFFKSQKIDNLFFYFWGGNNYTILYIDISKYVEMYIVMLL